MDPRTALGPGKRRLAWQASGRPVWLGVGAALAAFLAVALLVGPGDIRAPTLPAELSRQPDAYLRNGTVEQYRPEGTLHYRMRIARAEFFERRADAAANGAATGGAQGATADVESPSLDFYAPPGPPWRIEASAGRIRSVQAPNGGHEERVDLVGDARLTRTEGDGTTLVLRTDALTLYPAREIVRSDQGVSIERGAGSRSFAAGFEADLANGRFRLFSDTDRRVFLVVQPSDFR